MLPEMLMNSEQNGCNEIRGTPSKWIWYTAKKLFKKKKRRSFLQEDMPSPTNSPLMYRFSFRRWWEGCIFSQQTKIKIKRKSHRDLREEPSKKEEKNNEKYSLWKWIYNVFKWSSIAFKEKEYGRDICWKSRVHASLVCVSTLFCASGEG